MRPMVRCGPDKKLEELANQFLGKGNGRRGAARDAEKMSYESGFVSVDELHFYDPTNDWDTQDSVFAVVVDPGDIAYVAPTICSGVDDGNDVVRNPKLLERRALMRHVEDDDDWGPAEEEIPPLGVNDGDRKVCAKCKKSKGLMFFSPDARNVDGLHSWCKECRKEFTSQKRNNARSEH